MLEKLDITIADVNEYYSEASNAIREIFRDSDHIGIGGLDGTQALARRVGFKATDRVLDGLLEEEKKREIIDRLGQQAYDQICERFEILMAPVRAGKFGEGRFIGRKQ